LGFEPGCPPGRKRSGWSRSERRSPGPAGSARPIMREIKAAVHKQGEKAAGLSVEDLEARAQALPPTLRAPVEVQLPGQTSLSRSDPDRTGQTGFGRQATSERR
jgi:hypothetical protein